MIARNEEPRVSKRKQRAVAMLGSRMSSQEPTGGCQCGALRYVVPGRLGRASICHCRMCQRALGNAFAPFVTAPGLTWTRGALKHFRSSNKARRGFCADCGTPLTYEADGHPPEITIATLDDATAVRPAIQVGTESALPWLRTLHELPTRSPEEEASVAPFFAGLISHQSPPKE